MKNIIKISVVLAFTLGVYAVFTGIVLLTNDVVVLQRGLLTLVLANLIMLISAMVYFKIQKHYDDSFIVWTATVGFGVVIFGVIGFICDFLANANGWTIWDSSGSVQLLYYIILYEWLLFFGVILVIDLIRLICINDQHRSNQPDFAHCQISLSARLAYKLHNAPASLDEEVSYLAGWLGDAVLPENNGTTSLKNDDYCADLDAENTYRLILQGYTSVEAFSLYYSSFIDSANRATIFLNSISYETVQSKVFYHLIDRALIEQMTTASESGDIYTVNYCSNLINDEDYHWDLIRNSYHDTYNFLLSLQDHRTLMEDYQ